MGIRAVVTKISEKRKSAQAAYRARPENKLTASARSKLWYWSNKERSQAYFRARALSNPARRMVYDASKRAKKKGIPFGITESDVVIPNFCPVLGLPLSIGVGACHDGSPTIDRLDNDRGYERGNIVVVSSRANRIKNDATIDELRAIVAYYEALL